MSEQMESTSAELEGNAVEDEYEGDLGDGAKQRSNGVGYGEDVP